MKCEYLKFMFGRHCARRWSWAWCINESDLYFCILTFVLLQSVCKSMHETLFRRQVSILFALITRLFSIRRWLLKTIRHYSPLFALFVLFAIRDYSLFAIRYSRLFAIRYSGFPDTPVTTSQQTIDLYISIEWWQLIVSVVSIKLTKFNYIWS